MSAFRLSAPFMLLLLSRKGLYAFVPTTPLTTTAAQPTRSPSPLFAAQLDDYGSSDFFRDALLDEQPERPISSNARPLTVGHETPTENSPPTPPTNPSIVNKGPKRVLDRLLIMANAATLDAQRMAHASLGAASLGLGAWHTAALFSSHALNLPFSQQETLLHGFVHIACTAAGVSRMNFKNRAERARNGLMFPILTTNIWLLWTSQTEWAMGSAAPLSMADPIIQLFTVANIGVCFWQLYEVYRASTDEKQLKSGLWDGNPLKNLFMVLTCYHSFLLWFFISFLAVSTHADLSAYDQLIARFPDFGQMITNSHVDTIWVLNLGSFLVSVFKYKAIDLSKVYLVLNGFNLVVGGAVMAAFMSVGDGEALRQWASFGGF